MTTESLNLRIAGMHCSACVGRVERIIGKHPTVESVSVDLLSERARVIAPSQDVAAIAARLEKAGFSAALLPDHSDDDEEPASERWGAKIALSLSVGVIAMVLSMPLMHGDESMGAGLMAPVDAVLMATIPGIYSLDHQILRWLMLLLCLPVIGWAGRHYFERAWRTLRGGGADMNVLIALGAGTAFVVSVLVTVFADSLQAAGLPQHVWFEVVPWVIGLLMVGNVLEDRAKRRATSALREIASLQPRVATIVREDGEQVEVQVRGLTRIDRVQVRPGDRLPVDGVVLEGASSIDESMLTGESHSVSKAVGSIVTGGTINGSGRLLIQPTTLGAESVIARIGELVRTAQAAKPNAQRIADRIAAVFVPAVVVIAVGSAAIWALFGPDPKLVFALHALVTVLIIACPCAMGLAVPAAITVATGQAARNGTLIRTGQVLETAPDVDTIIFDKTGTLTEGKPRVVGSEQPGSDDALALIRALALVSEHPIAAAIAKSLATDGATVAEVENHAGGGITATSSDGRTVSLGSEQFMESMGVRVPPGFAADYSACTVSFAAVGGEVVASFALRDVAKPEAASALRSLRARGYRLVLLSGDREGAVAELASELEITEFHSGASPSDKIALVEQLRAEGANVAMVGDGVNDAPALAAADLGVAMGTGTDVAAATADVTLMSGDLHALERLLDLATRTRRVIRQNLGWALGYNALGIPVAAGLLYPAFGVLLSPVFASAAMALSSVSVLSNSLRLGR
jgi:Cu+-exporting ATPase